MKFQADASSPVCSENYLRRSTARLTRPEASESLELFISTYLRVIMSENLSECVSVAEISDNIFDVFPETHVLQPLPDFSRKLG